MKTNIEILNELKAKKPVDRGGWNQLIIYNQPLVEFIDFLDRMENFAKGDYPYRQEESDKMANGAKSKVKPVYFYPYVYFPKEEYYLLGYDEKDRSFCLTGNKDFESIEYVFATIANEYGAWYVNEILEAPVWLPPFSSKPRKTLYVNQLVSKEGNIVCGQYEDGRYFMSKLGLEYCFNADYEKQYLNMTDDLKKQEWMKLHQIKKSSKSNEELLKELRHV